MLVRTFRLTDKLSNAFLRLSIWCAHALLMQAYHLRLAVISSSEALWFTILQTVQSGRAVYQTSEERRRAIMARRSAEALTRPTVREDPLKTQNRALSMFTVVLMASLIMMVLWFTGNGQTNTQAPSGGGGPLPLLQTKTAPASFPTIVPTLTPIPDIGGSGSVVYAMRMNGHYNLWALGIGQTDPLRLTNSASDDRDPAWSPAGDRIAFASHRDGNWDLYVLNLTTGATSRLTYDLDYEAAPTWSPDGTFIAYEAFENGVLGINILKADGSEKSARLPFASSAPHFSPAWSPGDGRRIAYVTLRNGASEIDIIDLNKPDENSAIRLLNPAGTVVDKPVWSPDGQQIAYNARVDGRDLVFARSVAQPQLDPAIVGQGHDPTWSPNGTSLIFSTDNGTTSSLVGGKIGNFGVLPLAYQFKGLVSHPSWTSTLLPTALQSSAAANTNEPPLYKEEIHSKSDAPPYYLVVQLNGLLNPNLFLSDRVDDSFVALRQEVVKQAGFDFLGSIKDALWKSDRLPDPGQSRQSWHYAGRAFDFDKFLVFGNPPQPPPIEVVREDNAVSTFWRVYLRVPEELQNGQLGEPLKSLPWDFASRTSGDPDAFENGGRPKAEIPSGYYVDFTQIAEDFGWLPVPSSRDWRGNYDSILYWEFDKREGLTWNEAMLEIYSQPDVVNFLSGPTDVPTPQALPTQTVDRGPTRTPTPIPPDVGQ